jgi:DNA/RNA-binding domain of Phe-tRNA-synthetase-like protein
MIEAGSRAPIVLELDPALAGRVRAGSVFVSPVAVGPIGSGLAEEIESLGGELRDRFAGLSPSQIPDLAAARDLYKAFGIDPTKTRPSSEALLRRVLRDRPFPRILNAVDLGNLLALRFMLPIGLYDASKVASPVLLRTGLPDESYAGIRRDDVHLHGRPVLVDRNGPFGNPTADSLRTSVEPSTRSLWLVLFATASYPDDRFRGHLETACASMERHLVPDDATATTFAGLAS